MILQKANNLREYLLYSAPLFVFLVLVIGLQYNVGTDYRAYYDMSAGIRSYRYITQRGEFLFVALIKLAKQIEIPQLLFVFSAIVQMFFLFNISYIAKKKFERLDLFFILFFVFSIAFFNQFNLVRQYIAVYISALAVIILSDDKYILATLLFLVACLFHTSAIYMLIFTPLSFILKSIKISKKVALVIIGLLILSYLFDFTNLVEQISNLVPQYRHYISSSYFDKLEFKSVVTKLPKVFLVVYVFLKNKESYYKDGDFLFFQNLSFISIVVLVFSFHSSVIWRFYQYFDIFTIFPVLVYLDKSDKSLEKRLIIGSLTLLLLTKLVLLPSGEYIYNSILFL